MPMPEAGLATDPVSAQLGYAITHRLICGWLLVALTALAMPSCASLPSGLRPIIIIATATSAEPRATLPIALRADLVNLAKASKKAGQATVRRITSPDGPVVEKDLTPQRPNGEVQHAAADADRQIDGAINEVAVQMQSARASAPGLALLPLLDRASQLPDSAIEVLSSGATTDDPTAFQQLGFNSDPVAVVNRLAAQGVLPNLSGHSVTFYGLGITAGSQAHFQPFERQMIETFWMAVCQKANADSCTLAEDAPSSEPPIATLPVPVIPVTNVKTENGCVVWQRLSDGDALHFAPNSPVLPPDADAALAQIVASVRSCRQQVSVAGYVADTGNGDAGDLSGRRARAVADRLVMLGLPPSALGTVEGRGTSDPVVVNFTAGQFDEDKAELNRRTELTFSSIVSG